MRLRQHYCMKRETSVLEISDDCEATCKYLTLSSLLPTILKRKQTDINDQVHVIHRHEDKNNVVGTRRSLLQSCAFGILIEISAEEQSRMYLFVVEGLDTAISIAFLILSFSICLQSQIWALLLEAALKQLCP